MSNRNVLFINVVRRNGNTSNIPRKPHRFWESEENVINFISKLKESNNLNKIEDWNSLTNNQIIKNGGARLLNNKTLYEIKCIGCPEGKEYFKIKNKKGYWKKKENQKNFILKLKEKYNLNTIEDWNLLTSKQINLLGGGYFLNEYSLFDIKTMGCPEGKDQFLKPKRSLTYWKSEENIKNFLQEIKQIYQLETPEQWNLLTEKQIKLQGGNGLLKNYSVYEIKCLACPEVEKFSSQGRNKSKISKGYWENKENIIQFLNEIKEKLNIKTKEDWKKLTKKQIQDHGGSGLFLKYSIFDLKLIICPSLKNEIKPPKSPGYWDKMENINNFLKNIQEELHLQSPEDWEKKLTKKIIFSYGGFHLFSKFTMFELKCLACPDVIQFSHLRKYNPKPNGYWNNENNILEFIENLRNSFQLKTPDDWNNLTIKNIHQLGGKKLLEKYSIFQIKCLGCPEVKILFSHQGKNQKKPAGYWENKNNLDEFLDRLKDNYNLETNEDWYRLSTRQIHHFGGGSLLTKYKLNDIIENRVDHNNDSKEFDSATRYKRSSQRWLFLQIQKLFPDEEIIEDFYHNEIARNSGFSVQFDVFIINRKIAIEYQGIQHYEDIPGNFASLEMYQFRDKEKMKLCEQYGIHLVLVPYHWDNTLESLVNIFNSSLSESVKNSLYFNVQYEDNKNTVFP